MPKKLNELHILYHPMDLAMLPYDNNVSAASMTPPLYLMPNTDAPVTIGRLV